MNNSLKKSLAGLTLIAIGVAAGWGLSQWRSSTHAVDGAAPQAGAAAERKVLYWYDPMSPTQKFDKPGKSPFMDMDLVPKYADEDAQDSVGLSVSAKSSAPTIRFVAAIPWSKSSRRALLMPREKKSVANATLVAQSAFTDLKPVTHAARAIDVLDDLTLASIASGPIPTPPTAEK